MWHADGKTACDDYNNGNNVTNVTVATTDFNSLAI